MFISQKYYKFNIESKVLLNTSNKICILESLKESSDKNSPWSIPCQVQTHTKIVL